jgi:flagellar biosynthetic protein FlhB
MPGTVVFPEQIMPMLQTQVILTLSWVCGLMIPIVIADYMWKRHSYNKKQKMSMKELKDEHKDSEGDPQVKGKRQQIRRERAQQAIAMSVPKATLILTNPTHYSVALRYERGVDMAPTCVAKGTDLMAARIRKIAHEHEIPVIESRALARALYATVEVDQVIPEAHWPAVAELVGFVMDLKNNVKRKLPVEASLRKD